ncbi:MAG: lipid-A-disaccharide synthase [Acidobacteriota bacterium]
MPPTIFISAGEASGEAYGALLIDELKRQLAASGQSAAYIGMGGPRMVAAGLDRIVRAEDVAVMGITEVVHHLPRIYREFRKLKRALRERRPSVAVFIDFPDIHFKLAEECHRLGIPVVYFVSPQLWAWKKHRIKLVQKYVDRMLVIFPFEEPFYRDRGVQAEFVGHPLAEIPPPAISREDFARQNNLDPAATWIALLPGSRAKEIRDNLPEMLASARALTTKGAMEEHRDARAANHAKGHDFSRAANAPTKEKGALAPDGTNFQFIVPLAATLTEEQRSWAKQFVHELAPGLPIRLIGAEGAVGRTAGAAEGAVGPTAGAARAALFHSRAAIVASGTATVEAALIGNPFVVVYRVSPLTYAIAKRVVDVPHVAMVNLIAGKRIVPELIQNDFTASNIVSQLQPLLSDGPPRQSMMQELAALRAMLQVHGDHPGAEGAVGRTAGARVAQVTLELLREPVSADTAPSVPF